MNPSLESLFASLPKTAGDVSRLESFANWQAEEISGGGYSRSEGRRDRFSRCHDAAEDGADGSTHAGHIADFRSFGRELFSEAGNALWRLDLTDAEAEEGEEALSIAEAAFDADCDRLEEWHRANGSLHEQIG
jgi:hypothetical protein